MVEVLTGTVLLIMGVALVILAAVCGLMLSMQRRILRNQIEMLDYLASLGLLRHDNINDIRPKRRFDGPRY